MNQEINSDIKKEATRILRTLFPYEMELVGNIDIWDPSALRSAIGQSQRSSSNMDVSGAIEILSYTASITASVLTIVELRKNSLSSEDVAKRVTREIQLLDKKGILGDSTEVIVREVTDFYDRKQ